MESVFNWALLLCCFVVTIGITVVMFIRRSSNVNLGIKALGLDISFSAVRAGREKNDDCNEEEVP